MVQWYINYYFNFSAAMHSIKREESETHFPGNKRKYLFPKAQNHLICQQRNCVLKPFLFMLEAFDLQRSLISVNRQFMKNMKGAGREKQISPKL